MVRIIWSPQSVLDLKGIYDFIALGSKRYAKDTVEEVRRKTNILNNFPMSGRIVPEFSRPNIREVIFGNYRIVYWITSKT